MRFDLYAVGKFLYPVCELILMAITALRRISDCKGILRCREDGLNLSVRYNSLRIKLAPIHRKPALIQSNLCVIRVVRLCGIAECVRIALVLESKIVVYGRNSNLPRQRSIRVEIVSGLDIHKTVLGCDHDIVKICCSLNIREVNVRILRII